MSATSMRIPAGICQLWLLVWALLSVSSEAFSKSEYTHINAPLKQDRRELLVQFPTTMSSDCPINRRDLLAKMAVAGLVLSFPGTSNAYESTTLQKPSDAPLQTLRTSPTTADAANTPIDLKTILQKASKKAVGGGKAGASAAVVQVLSLMWLRTSLNFQYRYGGNLQSSLKTLWDEGGIPRLYQGLPFALIQGPLTRFGDTAANVGILALLESTPETQALPLPIKTAIGSISAGTWRIVLMPIDASKTAMQVEGAVGLKNLWGLAANEGPGALYQGALAQAAATAVGHFRKCP